MSFCIYMHVVIQKFCIFLCKGPEDHGNHSWPMTFGMEKDDASLRLQGLELPLNYSILMVSTYTTEFNYLLCLLYIISK